MTLFYKTWTYILLTFLQHFRSLHYILSIVSHISHTNNKHKPFYKH